MLSDHSLNVVICRVTSTRPTAYARSEANIEQIVDGLHEQAVCIVMYYVTVLLYACTSWVNCCLGQEISRKQYDASNDLCG